MAAKSAPHSYVNVLPSGKGGVTVDRRNAPVGKVPHGYINLELKDSPGEEVTINGKSEEASASDCPVSNGLEDPSSPSSSTNTPTTTGRGDSLKRHSSLDEGRYSTVTPRRTPGSSAEQTVADAKLGLFSPERSGSCENCEELNQLLAMWEIGVSGLTRNYSRILAHLIKIRHSSMALEFRLNNATVEPGPLPKCTAIPEASLIPPARVPKNRQSMFVNDGFSASGNIRDRDIAENMYPTRRATTGTSNAMTGATLDPTAHQTTPSSASYAGDIKDLNSHLEEAIDLCQQLAAACFKTNHLSGSTSISHIGSSAHHASPSMWKHSAGGSPSANMYKPSLHSITETRGRTSRKQRKLERVPSAPSLEQSGEMTSSGPDFESGFVKISKDEVPDTVTKSAAPSGLQSDGTENGVKGEELVVSAGEAASQTSPDDDKDAPRGPSMRDAEVGSSSSSAVSAASQQGPTTDLLESLRGTDPDAYRPISSISTYSDSDVKCIMSKIASLEEERYKLLETINALQEDNSVVRSSLHEILGDLGNKDLQLMLAMQDLTIATGEIKMATEMRRRLDALSSERDLLLDKLGDLEDESAAVKVSLIQLLQEKSATNKTLVLENFRLSQRVRQKSSTGESPAASAAGTGDNVSIHSAYSTTVEDTTMQEAYMGAAMSENFVHKQGFLVKQGGKVKNWKRRLFVLNTEGLSYYKTEQPIQTVPIERIDKVVICHRTCPQPNMFEVHTQGRTFFLSASSADEMQSWVGMLETLKQYKKTATLHREANLRASALRRDQEDNPTVFSSPERDSLSPALGAKTSEEEEEEEEGEGEHLVLHQVAGDAVAPPPSQGVALQLDDDDTAYLHTFTSGSVPSHLSHRGSAGSGTAGDGKSSQPPTDLLASLDLHNM